MRYYGPNLKHVQLFFLKIRFIRLINDSDYSTKILMIFIDVGSGKSNGVQYAYRLCLYLKHA